MVRPPEVVTTGEPVVDEAGEEQLSITTPEPPAPAKPPGDPPAP